jgi:hypothetical protein
VDRECNVYSEIAQLRVENWKTEKAVGKLRRKSRRKNTLQVPQMSDNEPEAPPVKKEKRKINEKQMANLRKGMEMMKAKRAEREQFEEKKAKGEIPADAPKPVAPAKAPKVVKASVPVPPPEVVIVQRKKRETKPNPALAELAALRAEVSALKTPAKEVTVEKVVEKVVDKVIHKDRVVTGSEMLNAIFGLK